MKEERTNDNGGLKTRDKRNSLTKIITENGKYQGQKNRITNRQLVMQKVKL